jgi:hypothetical protein
VQLGQRDLKEFRGFRVLPDQPDPLGLLVLREYKVYREFKVSLEIPVLPVHREFKVSKVSRVFKE